MNKDKLNDISNEENKVVAKNDENVRIEICRICYCSNEDETLITPCRCSGSMKFIHESCLQTWLQSKTKRCEVCKEFYRLRLFAKSYSKRTSPKIMSWHLAAIIKELVVLDWFHFLETAFICISLMVINRMSSFDLVYQFALIGIVELLYYCLNFLSCFFLLYFEKWSKLNLTVKILNFNDSSAVEEDVSFFIKCLDKYACLLYQNKRLKTVVDQILEADVD